MEFEAARAVFVELGAVPDVLAGGWAVAATGARGRSTR